MMSSCWWLAMIDRPTILQQAQFLLLFLVKSVLYCCKISHYLNLLLLPCWCHFFKTDVQKRKRGGGGGGGGGSKTKLNFFVFCNRCISLTDAKLFSPQAKQSRDTYIYFKKSKKSDPMNKLHCLWAPHFSWLYEVASLLSRLAPEKVISTLKTKNSKG